MGGHLYELSEDKLEPIYWTDESSFYEDDNVEYTEILEGEERDEAIEIMCSSKWFNQLFVRGEEKDTIIYNGGVDAILDEWYNSIQHEFEKLRNGRKSDSYNLRKSIDNALGGCKLFCFPNWTGIYTVEERELLEYIHGMKQGTVLHINSVFSYKY